MDLNQTVLWSTVPLPSSEARQSRLEQHILYFLQGNRGNVLEPTGASSSHLKTTVYPAQGQRWGDIPQPRHSSACVLVEVWALSWAFVFIRVRTLLTPHRCLSLPPSRAPLRSVRVGILSSVEAGV